MNEERINLDLLLCRLLDFEKSTIFRTSFLEIDDFSAPELSWARPRWKVYGCLQGASFEIFCSKNVIWSLCMIFFLYEELCKPNVIRGLRQGSQKIQDLLTFLREIHLRAQKLRK